MTTTEGPGADQPAAEEPALSPLERWGPASGAQRVGLVLALMFLAGVGGYLVAVLGDRPPARESVDVGFLQDMITHHEQAVEMSNIELAAGTDPGIRSFAREILLFQAYEIGLMEGKLGQWGYRTEDRPPTAMGWMHEDPYPAQEMPGMASEAEMERLADVDGSEVDALFVRLMQDHHRGGIHMAAYAERHASDPFVRDLAGRMARTQRIEVRELEAALVRAGLAEPLDYEPSPIPADPGGA